ncbi:MAG: DUF721 domain-containing protein [Deferribacteraceae bacterium]|nr:DUF721 domain-containing protein [Deferribacteraceae bacterium]
MYKKQPVALKEIFDEVGGSQRGITDILRLQRAWSVLMGERIATVTFPYRLKKGLLSVAVCDQIWLAEFPYIKEGMINKIKTYGIDLSDIRFKLSKMRQPVLPLPKEKQSLTNEQEKKIGALAAEIRNNGIREAYAGALTAFFRRKI